MGYLAGTNYEFLSWEWLPRLSIHHDNLYDPYKTRNKCCWIVGWQIWVRKAYKGWEVWVINVEKLLWIIIHDEWDFVKKIKGLKIMRYWILHPCITHIYTNKWVGLWMEDISQLWANNCCRCYLDHFFFWHKRWSSTGFLMGE